MIQREIDEDIKLSVIKRSLQFETIAEQTENPIFHLTIFVLSNVEKIKCFNDLLGHVQAIIMLYFL